MIEMIIIVACTNASGEPELVVVENVNVTDAQRNDGVQYGLAKAAVDANGFTGPFVCFEPQELPEVIAHCILENAPSNISAGGAVAPLEED